MFPGYSRIISLRHGQTAGDASASRSGENPETRAEQRTNPPRAAAPLRILILNQAFYPDVASSAQHASELATALSERGHAVSALCSARCYDNPAVEYSSRETWHGVRIRRIWSSGFGKKARWRRAVDFGSYLANCVWRVFWMPRHDVVVALTSPPLISFLAALLVQLKGGELIFWAMDLNPDEAIAAGWLAPASFTSRMLQKMLLHSIHASRKIIALDRFMAERLLQKGAGQEKIEILPPWSHSRDVFFDPQGRGAFRAAHGLDGKFVVMYSGNHSPCHPLATLLRAALELREDIRLAFVFVGGGSEFAKVRAFAAEHRLTNMQLLPYQPLASLSASLSSADLHTVVMGDPFVGTVHPCKIYNILMLGTPVLYIGPGQSHIVDMSESVESNTWFYEARHDDVPRVVRSILTARDRAILDVADERLLGMRFSRDALLAPHIETIESAAQLAPTALSSPEPSHMKTAV